MWMGCSFKRQKRLNYVNGLEKVLNKSDHKPNKVWVDKECEFFDSVFKKWLKK